MSGGGHGASLTPDAGDAEDTMSPGPPHRRLYRYLRGAWSVVKRVEYGRGGEFGTWRGAATFEATAALEELRLVERGAFYFDRDPDRGVDATAKPLAFDCSRPRVEVFFDDVTPRQPFYAFDAEAALCRQRPDDDDAVSSSFSGVGDDDAVAVFTHLCGPDTYRGSIRVYDDDHFGIGWTVSGPAKDGVIRQDFFRSGKKNDANKT